MLERRVIDGLVFYESPLLRAAGVPHAFSTRIGGSSPRPFDSLNLGNPSGCDVQDHYPRIYENYTLLQRAISVDDRQRCWVHQVHGGEVAVIDRGGAFESGAKADAMVTDDPERVLSVRIADCVPVLMSSADGTRVAAVHAGWRGVIAGIAPRALALLADAGAVAAIGPCISLEHFEVGPEVLEQFERAFNGQAPLKRRDDGKGQVDLRAAIVAQLRAAGLDETRIDLTDRCTYRDADEFFSHRRDRGITGRMAALISPRI